MDIINVLIIYNSQIHSREEIKKDLQDEGYKHNFIFHDKLKTNEEVYKILDMVDEVWTFGRVESSPIFKLAEERGCDIWQMA